MSHNYLFVYLLLIIFLATSSASALPPINTEWKAKYLRESAPESLKEAAFMAKCAVCHVGGGGKVLNDYGRAVRMFLRKADINQIKDNPENLKKFVDEGLEKAAAEKNATGMTFGELIKAGKLPGDR